MKFFKRFLPVFLLFVAVFVGTGADAEASASDENINVSVSMDSEVIFHSDCTPFQSMFIVWNDSNVPIEITAINMTEFNDWQLVSSDTQIKADKKQFVYQFDGQDMLGGRNEMSLEIEESASAIFQTQISYGVWSHSVSMEKALEIEVQYEIEKEKYTLTLEGGDYAEDSMLQVTEGVMVTLPELRYDTYEFMGWADSSGKRYTDTFTMPKENTALTALWNLPVYALYSRDDYSLTFVQSEKEIKVGETHNGKTITAVYTDFTEKLFEEGEAVPWLEDGYCRFVQSVVFEDPVFPQSTAYWFMEFNNCTSFDVAKLYTFRVHDMRFMYNNAGCNEENTDFVITGMENWDTSQVINMWSMFSQSGQYVKAYNIGNIGLWDVSNVLDMQSMFGSAAMDATEVYIGDLSTWNTSSLELMIDMFWEMGCKAKNLSIGNIGNWDVSHVDMMTNVFSNMGEYADTVYIGNLSQWDVSNVEDFSWMFSSMAAHAKEFNVGDLNQWNMTKAEYTAFMFYGAGEYAESFYLGDISKWNVENVYDMSSMFENAGRKADWKLDLAGWNVGSAVRCLDFFTGVEDKIIEPIWKY